MNLRQIPFLLLSAFFMGCGGSSTQTVDSHQINRPKVVPKEINHGTYNMKIEEGGLTYFMPYDEGYPITLQEYDESAHFKGDGYEYSKEIFKDKKPAPAFDFAVKLEGKSWHELRQLRMEIFARKGFLFMDYLQRAYFNKTNWYYPVYWVENYKMKLSAQELEFIEKVLKLEAEEHKKRYTKDAEGHLSPNMDYVKNMDQYKNLSASMKDKLAKDGFFIKASKAEQLFHIYDNGYYSYVPTFVTSDLYLQVLHMHVSKEMQMIEESFLIDKITSLCKTMHSGLTKFQNSKNPTTKKSAEWAQAFFAVPYAVLSGSELPVAASVKSAFALELEKVKGMQGKGSKFTGDSIADYTQLQPRANYTRTEPLKKYFTAVKWLLTAPVFIDTDEGLSTAIVIAHTLSSNASAMKDYTAFSEITGFLAGLENNLSLNHVIKLLKETGENPENLCGAAAKLADFRKKLYAMDPKRMFVKGVNDVTQEFAERKKVLFAAGRYTFDGEILQRLIHVTDPAPKRPFPKGLDVFATMGSYAAEDILLNDFKENEKWPGYKDTLQTLKNKFASFAEWDMSVYNKTMDMVLALNRKDETQPYYMLKENWERKNLNTMLAAWTGLKHDMILYIEQPMAAEMGGGEEVPPPNHLGYVEPNVHFWKKALELLALNEKMLMQHGLYNDKLKGRNNALKEVGERLLSISEQEIKGERVSEKDLSYLSYIGGTMESITLSIIDMEGLTFVSNLTSPERYISIVADVYTYKQQCLEEGIGFGDEIYVIAEINGQLLLTRGAVYSQYEFTQPTSERLTDEKWQEMLLSGKKFERHSWIKPIFEESEENIELNAEYSFF